MGMGDSDTEDSVVYNDPGQGIRRLRGTVIDDPASQFVVVQRRDGEIQIARAIILKIEKGRRG